jgi:D-alanyl-lipoteichoic acid acyltransferase DltB (MBOAT superfamily)
VGARKERPSFFDTMEYFIAPAFWLSPAHAAHLVFDRMRPAPLTRSRAECAGWIARGFLHAVLFTLLAGVAVPRLQARYEAGISSFLWWEWLLLGPLLFALTYLEKSRVSYLVAGLLSFSGRDVCPDFRSPWLARSLPEYWRRFHFWIWEYYVDFIYMPLSALLRDHLSIRAASLWALFLTFSIGTSLIHWVHYPAPFEVALLLGCVFGLLTVLHGLAGRRLEESRFGVPLTWLSVFFLYAVAYPVYGLGWHLRDLITFLGR